MTVSSDDHAGSSRNMAATSGVTQHLSLRTDSSTLKGATLSEPRAVTRSALRTDSMESASSSSHQKMPSASSLSSLSSTGSKTAAFFSGANLDNPVRPAASTSSTSLASASRLPSSPPSLQTLQPFQSEQYDENGDSSFISASSSVGDSSLNAVRTARAPTFSDSITAPDGATSTGRRSWIDFEGKPIIPLPSPGSMTDEPSHDGADIDRGYGFPLESRSATQHESTEVPTRRFLTSFYKDDGRSRSGSTAKAQSAANVEPSKTKNFFGSAWSSNQPISAKEARPTDQESSNNDRFASTSTISAASSSRTLSEEQTLYTPSRYPSTSARHARPGSTNETSPVKQTSRPLADSQSLGSVYSSPPSPEAYKRQLLDVSFDGVSRNGHSRHTHGPSENVTHSSILPHAQLLHVNEPQDERNYVGSLGQRGNESTLFSSTSFNVPQFSAPQDAWKPIDQGEGEDEEEDEASGRVGAYSVERVLGVGAFSRVVLAKRTRGQPTAAEEQAHALSSGLVALKMLEKEPCRQNERMRVSWVREVEVLKHIVHPNIVRFMTSFSTNRHHVLVLESVQGGELFEYLAQAQRDIAQREWLVRRLFGELANAVGWMHQIHLVHRDIKLENIILTQSFRAIQPLTPSQLPNEPLIKLSDFGLSRFIDPQSPLLETRCGSEEYAAPELIIGKKYDGRQTDVWAMGVVLYALLSGSLPFLSDVGSPALPFNREDQQQQQQRQLDARARKAQLLRIAKGDLRWPAQANDRALDVVDDSCPVQHRLITPSARVLVARLLRRDATKRCQAWHVWDEGWMTEGSFGGQETSMQGQSFEAPPDPRSARGQSWLSAHARVHAGAPDVVHDD